MADNSVVDLILSIILALCVCGIIYLLLLFYRLHQSQKSLSPGDNGQSTTELANVTQGEQAQAQQDENQPNAVSDQHSKRNWKIEFEDIEMGPIIGQGAIGKVHKGKWRGLTVAVKEIIHSAKDEQVQDELALIIKVRHPNLVLFMGVAQPSQDKLCIVSEYMGKGNLYTVLHDKSLKLDWKKRMGIALDAARAMNYLHCSKPAIVHKTLNSINILLDNQLVAKVSDYGLDDIRAAAKKSGVYTQPLWVAPELFKKDKGTKSSDVYSFGIILWEILTRRTPYQGMIRASNHLKAIQDIANGMRPDIPAQCPPRYAQLMQACWNADPNKRPTFQEIVDQLLELEKEKIESSVLSALDGSSTSVEQVLDWRSQDRQPWMVQHDEIHYDAVVGKGSFGEVWSGTFRGKKVAIKKLNSIQQNKIKDFIKELNIMCSLRHPNTVLFMGACLEEGHMCIIMEYCGKGNLFDILHDVSQPIDYNLIIKILTEVAEGVLYLHLNNPPILHRDLKSLNILVDEDWNIKVSDFGLTDFKPDIDGAQNLQQGTPFWLAPESMERGEYSERSDVYAFGMVVWELFTRDIPFTNMSPHQAALAVITEDKRPDIPLFVPPKFAQLIQQCWSRDPSKRPSFPQVIEALAVLKKEGLPRIELSLANTKLYRKKTTVFAFKSKDAVIVYKPWGTGEGKKGDWVLVGPGDDVYTCDAAIFAKTYSLVDKDKPHLYRKTGSIFALQMDRDFLMETLEGMEHGSKGDWIAQNPVDGEQWPIAAKTFAAMYELAPDQTLPTSS